MVLIFEYSKVSVFILMWDLVVSERFYAKVSKIKIL